MCKHLLGPYSVKPKNKNSINFFVVTNCNVPIEIENSPQI